MRSPSPIRWRSADAGAPGRAACQGQRRQLRRQCRVLPTGGDRQPTGAAAAAATAANRARGSPSAPVAVQRHRQHGTPRGAAVHPVTLWRGRLSVALDALQADADTTSRNRASPVETTDVQLPTGDRLQIPTGAETLRLKSYLIMGRNSSRTTRIRRLVDPWIRERRGGAGRDGPVLLWSVTPAAVGRQPVGPSAG